MTRAPTSFVPLRPSQWGSLATVRRDETRCALYRLFGFERGRVDRVGRRGVASKEVSGPSGSAATKQLI